MLAAVLAGRFPLAMSAYEQSQGWRHPGEAIMRKDQPSLPTNRAFVIQLHADAQLERGDFKGRVEHIKSRQAAHFTSAEELLAFIAHTLRAQQAAEAVSDQMTKG